MKNKHEGAPLHGSGCSEVHRRTAGNYHMIASSSANLSAFWSFQACFPGQRIPGFGT